MKNSIFATIGLGALSFIAGPASAQIGSENCETFIAGDVVTFECSDLIDPFVIDDERVGSIGGDVIIVDDPDVGNAVTRDADEYFESNTSIIQSVTPGGAAVLFTGQGGQGLGLGQFWSDEDIVSGETGVLVENDGEASSPFDNWQHVYLNGTTIEGTGGTAIDLGSGKDLVSISDGGATIIGDVLLGAGDDVLRLYFEDTPFEDFTLEIADTLFDGGDGFDTLDFSDVFSFSSALASAQALGSVFELDGDVLNVSAGDSVSASITNFEQIAFSDVTLTFSDVLDTLSVFDVVDPVDPIDPVGDPSIAPVPLPASMLLLLAGLGGLGLTRRSRKA